MIPPAPRGPAPRAPGPTPVRPAPPAPPYPIATPRFGWTEQRGYHWVHAESREFFADVSRGAVGSLHHMRVPLLRVAARKARLRYIDSITEREGPPRLWCGDYHAEMFIRKYRVERAREQFVRAERRKHARRWRRRMRNERVDSSDDEEIVAVARAHAPGSAGERGRPVTPMNQFEARSGGDGAV